MVPPRLRHLQEEALQVLHEPLRGRVAGAPCVDEALVLLFVARAVGGPRVRLPPRQSPEGKGRARGVWR
eukprot:8658210-Pyramimonas_sp.AAC.1